MKAVFIDTVALIALANADDELHERAESVYAVLARDGSTFVTSEWVLSEFLGGTGRISLRQTAIRIVDRFRQSGLIQIVPASHEAWCAAFDLYKAREDKEWSLVDCSSILICEHRAITDVLTADHHFTQAGLNVLIRLT
jgi:uncharacterized protein